MPDAGFKYAERTEFAILHKMNLFLVLFYVEN
jgi:hypothetical protein